MKIDSIHLFVVEPSGGGAVHHVVAGGVTECDRLIDPSWKRLDRTDYRTGDVAGLPFRICRHCRRGVERRPE